MRTLAWCCLLLILIGCNSVEPTITPSATPSPTAKATAAIGVNFVTKAPAKQTVLQITPTPLPSATATPSPTPIIYSVNQGDTFWSIAFGNRTTPDQLQALNPAINPDFLSVGDQLILPPPATLSYQTEIGTPVPLAIQVTTAHLFRTPSGSAWVMGTIENRGSVAAADVKIEIQLQNKRGDLVATATTWVTASVIEPGVQSPFSVLIRELPADEVDLVVSVIEGNSVQNLGSRYLDLVIEDSAMEIVDNRVSISGTISNTGNISATASLIATVLDPSGQVIGVAHIDQTEPIANATSAEFAISLTPLTANIADYRLIVIGRQFK